MASGRGQPDKVFTGLPLRIVGEILDWRDIALRCSKTCEITLRAKRPGIEAIDD